MRILRRYCRDNKYKGKSRCNVIASQKSGITVTLNNGKAGDAKAIAIAIARPARGLPALYRGDL